MELKCACQDMKSQKKKDIDMFDILDFILLYGMAQEHHGLFFKIVYNFENLRKMFRTELN